MVEFHGTNLILTLFSEQNNLRRKPLTRCVKLGRTLEIPPPSCYTTSMDIPLPDQSLAIKRLARDLRILVCVQVIVPCIVMLGPFAREYVPNLPGWDVIHSLCGALALLGVIAFTIVALWGSGKLMGSTFLPVLIRRYALSVWVLFPFILLGANLLDKHGGSFFLSLAFLSILPLYCIVPQFFIARWLTKKAKGGTTQLMAKPRPLFSRRTYLLIGITPLLAVCLLWGWITLLHWIIPIPPLVISEETTRVTGPLTDKGYVDYFKALEERFTPPELATDENGYRDFVRLFGDLTPDRKPEESEFYRQQIYEKLGLDPNVPPTLVLPDSPEKLILGFHKTNGDPWTLEQYPILADWVNDIDAPLDAIAEALRKPVFYPPLLQTPESVQSVMPENLFVISIRSSNETWRLSQNITQNFSARAGYRIAHGDIDGAIDDTISIMRWGRYVARTGTLAQYLIGRALEESARKISIGAHSEHPLTEQQIRRLLAELDALPPHRPLADVIEWDRYATLSFIQITAIDAPYGASLAEMLPQGHKFLRMLLPRFSWNVMFRRVNEMYDAMQEPPPRTKLDSIVDEADGLSVGRMLYLALIPGGRDTIIADALTAILAPTAAHQLARMQQIGCAENMQRLALAILLYEREHGEIPGADWATQIDQYLGENAAQYFSCLVHPLPEGFTRYALVQYGDTVGGSLMLVELSEAVPMDKAVITVDEVLEGKRWSWWRTSCNSVALHNGAVRDVWNEEILLRLLARGE